MVVRARSRARKSSRDAGERSGRSGTRERERERKGKDVSAAPSYPALIELLPPFYRARNKPYTYAPSLVNKPRPRELIIPKILQTVNNFPDIHRISVQKFPESLSFSLEVERNESVERVNRDNSFLPQVILQYFAINPGVVRRQIRDEEEEKEGVKEKNGAKRQAKLCPGKGGNCGLQMDRRTPSTVLEPRREPALFVPILRNATRFILQTHYARIDKNETERKHRPREREIEGGGGRKG